MQSEPTTQESFPSKALAQPTKPFFVTMITRDISLEDSILDLIDNSADAALRCEKSRPVDLTKTVDLKKYSVDIRLSEESFEILDTCGGLSLDDAANYAFSFGRRSGAPPSPYTVGVYGIGLKRAIFKIGTNILISSTHVHRNPSRGESPRTDSFQVPIDVPRWMKDESDVWDFDIEPCDPAEISGVSIRILQLDSSAATSFGSPSFLAALRDTISTAYALHLDCGLTIRLNGSEIKAALPDFRQSKSILPARIQTKDEQVTEVTVEILAGMSMPPPDDNEPDQSAGTEELYGWYLACNGRFVVIADKTNLTGWGKNRLPRWHRQYAGFFGVVLFSAEDPMLLPLTTTKRSIDGSSAVYTRAQLVMKELSRQWITYTNKRKGARKRARKYEAETKAVSISKIEARDGLKLPRLIAEPSDPETVVTYKVPSRELVNLALAFGRPRSSPSRVGKSSFDYAYRDLVSTDSVEDEP